MNAVEAPEWVFRHAGGCLIETPDLVPPVHPPAGVVLSGTARRWIMTLWRDEFVHDGWGTLVWQSGERGWQLPQTMAIGDVIEFGLIRDDLCGQPVPQQTVRWWGYLRYATVYGLVIVGPYRHPDQAVRAAQPLIDELRLEQLDPPGEQFVEPTPITGSGTDGGRRT